MPPTFHPGVSPNQIHTEIEQLSDERQVLWQRLSEGLDPSVQTQLKVSTPARGALAIASPGEGTPGFGERDEIVRRARAEERLERAA